MTQNVELTAFESYGLLFIIGSLLVWGIWNHLRLSTSLDELYKARQAAATVVEGAEIREQIYKTAFLQQARGAEAPRKIISTQALCNEAVRRERERSRWERGVAVKTRKETRKTVVAGEKLPYGLRGSRVAVAKQQAVAEWN